MALCRHLVVTIRFNVVRNIRQINEHHIVFFQSWQSCKPSYIHNIGINFCVDVKILEREQPVLVTNKVFYGISTSLQKNRSYLLRTNYLKSDINVVKLCNKTVRAFCSNQRQVAYPKWASIETGVHAGGTQVSETGNIKSLQTAEQFHLSGVTSATEDWLQCWLF